MAAPARRQRVLIPARASTDPAKIAPAIESLRVPLDSLTLDPENARHHDARSIEVVASILDRHGQVKPVVVQRRGRLLIVRAGNARVQAARLLGWKSIAATVIDEADDAAIAFALDDNRAAELSDWDPERLAKHVATLDPAELAGLFTDHELRIATGDGWVGPVADPAEIGAYDPASETAHDVVKNVHPDDVPRVRAILERVLAADPALARAKIEPKP